MDHIFGTLSTDALKLLYHRVGQHGIQHRGSISPRDPLPGDPVMIEALTGEDFAPEHLVVYYTTDGSAPDGSRGAALQSGVALMEPVETVWDSLTWRYLTRWRAALPPQADGVTVRYRIGGWTAEREVFADFPDAQRTVERAADAYFNKRPEPSAFAGDPQGMIFSYRVDRLRPPEWAKKMILYHLMVDRFSPGDGRGWTQTDDLNALCGGTLWGAAEKIDHIADLGCDAVWLSPVWESPTHHGYDVTDYTQVAAHFGGNDALRRFIDEAHARGIRVILDLVCNHISNQHPFFQEALHNPGSPCRSWFTFDESPLGYRTFFGVASMPQVNLADPGARDWMLDVARTWLSEYNADGYRLDYANGVTPEFWWAFRAACREAKPDSFVFGEIIEAPDMMRTYQGRLDGTLDFFAAEALRQVYGWKTVDAALLSQKFAAHYSFFDGDFVLPTFIDNHDMDRFLLIANGDTEAVRRAAAAQFALPQPPILYYGTEVAAQQKMSVRGGMGLHVNRVPMPWGDAQDRAMLDYYKTLIRERKNRLG